VKPKSEKFWAKVNLKILEKKLNFAAKERGGRDKEHNNRRCVKVQWLEGDKWNGKLRGKQTKKKENKANLIEVQKHLVRGLRGLESLWGETEWVIVQFSTLSLTNDEFLMEIWSRGRRSAENSNRVAVSRAADTQSNSLLIFFSRRYDLHAMIKHISEKLPRFVLLTCW
jgi:hypothetical protein